MTAIGKRTAVAVLALASGAMAAAGESGVDYHFRNFLSIDSTAPDAPNIVNAVLVVCPAAGTLVANASAQIHMTSIDGGPGEPSVQYGISRNSRRAQLNNYHVVRHYHPDAGFVDATAHFQRMESCQAGERVRFRVVAHLIDAGSAWAENASLVVQWVGGPRI